MQKDVMHLLLSYFLSHFVFFYLFFSRKMIVISEQTFEHILPFCEPFSENLIQMVRRHSFVPFPDYLVGFIYKNIFRIFHASHGQMFFQY